MQKLGIDKKVLARKVVNECLRVKAGENFWISCADNVYYDFAEEVAAAAIEAGAHPFISMWSDQLGKTFYGQSEEYLKRTSDFALNLFKFVDVQLTIAFPKDPDYLKGIPPEKLAAASIGAAPMWDAMFKRNAGRANIRRSSLVIPTPEAAEKYGISFEDYHQMVWTSLDIDYNALSARAKKIARLIDKEERVHITTDEGTDLRFSIKGRKGLVDDGIMDEEDIENNVFVQNLPTGEVYCAPVEDSAEGVAVFGYNIFMGEPLVNFRVRFKGGKIVEMEADEGLEHYKDVMEKNSGDKYQIAELGIGLNPEITRITGELALDEKIIGTIHIATGENRMFGGVNKSSMHKDLVMERPTLVIGDTIVMDRGEYRI